MPWEDIKLNTGASIPQIGFGTWKIPPPTTASNVNDAIESGFQQLDTAQAYGNEEQVGLGIKESGLSRKDIWVTTKWSGRPWGNGGSISPAVSIGESLSKMGLSYVDLYLVHTPRLFDGKIREGWQSIIELQKSGQTKAIGVSNFTLADMKELIEGGEKQPEILPAVNQIELHPYKWADYKENVEYCQKHGIAIEAYSPLKPLTTYPGGPVDKVINSIAKRLSVKPEQVLLAWIKSKGAIALTTSRTKERLEAYIAAGDVELTHDDIKAIEHAGAKGPGVKRRMAVRMIFGVALQLAAYYAMYQISESQDWE